MLLLPPSDYAKAMKALEAVTINHLFIRTVLEQKVDGTVYGDDLLCPRAFYVAHPYGMALLYGQDDGNEAFHQSLRAYFLNVNGVRTSAEWVQVFPHAWTALLEPLCGTKILRNTRVNFRFSPEHYRQYRANVSLDGYKIVRTDAALYGQMKGSVIPHYFWRNQEHFLREGVGYTVVCDDKPASTAYSAFIHEPEFEIGIETLAEYRGRGLAQLACTALIDYCMERDLTPVWSCRRENIGSYKLACKLGFEPTLELPFYQLAV
ncbi:MAG: GNAT family N-acetyltransferase [Verrucomicrobiota bacterium]|nr:GNAT family N-acetyltransferase [Verrucomicrobiota bacterium]